MKHPDLAQEHMASFNPESVASLAPETKARLAWDTHKMRCHDHAKSGKRRRGRYHIDPDDDKSQVAHPDPTAC
jgi:hypothetical protein